MKLIEGNNYTLQVHEPDLVETIYPVNTILDEKIADEIDATLERLNPGIKYYIISEAQGFFMISPGLRKAMAAPDFSRPVAAVAFYSREEKLNNVMETFNEKTPPKVPIKFFCNKEEAFIWLKNIRLLAKQ